MGQYFTNWGRDSARRRGKVPSLWVVSCCVYGLSHTPRYFRLRAEGGSVEGSLFTRKNLWTPGPFPDGMVKLSPKGFSNHSQIKIHLLYIFQSEEVSV